MSFGRLKHLARAATALIALTLTVSCGGDDDSRDASDATAGPTAAATATTAASAQEPVGLLAIGHSGLTGANSNPEAPGYDATENSWATGANPEVNSIYQRMLALLPETEGNVRNAAASGSGASELAQQAREGLGTVPAPALVIIQTIDNDIRCDGSDSARIPAFGEDIAAALQVITEASPNSKILMVTTLEGLTPEMATALAELIPSFKTDFSGTGPCGFFDQAGNLLPEKLDGLAGIVREYNGEQARACGEFPQCSTDGGAGARHIEGPEDWSDDGHPNIKGLRRWAELIWPEVERVLAAP